MANKPGAAATIAAAELATSKPDGYALGYFPILVFTLTPFYVKIKYDPLQGFEPLVGTAASPYGICVLPKAPWKTFKEMIGWARENPGKLSVSDTGKGSPSVFGFCLHRKEGKDTIETRSLSGRSSRSYSFAGRPCQGSLRFRLPSSVLVKWTV